MELSLYEGCLLWGNRVVIPTHVEMQSSLNYMQITRMKGLLMMYVWWQGITKDIESTVHNYTEYRMHQSIPPVAPFASLDLAYKTVGSDYAGPFQGKLILVHIDAHSKWVEAICTPGSTSNVVCSVWTSGDTHY